MNQPTMIAPDYAAGETIPEDYFEEHYKPLPAPNGVDTTVDFDTARAADERHVWTIVEAEGDLYAAAGFHRVNRTGDYVITERPWITGQEEAAWCLFDDEDEDSEGDDDHG